MTSTEVDVFVGNLVQIDWELHELWIKGLGVSEAVSVIKDRGIMKEYPGLTHDLIVSDVGDNFRLFSSMEQLLLTAGNFEEQLLYQMDPHTQHQLIERYYALDQRLCRELLAFKKLSSRVRKDLDDVAERVGAPVKSCRRQFDNIRRVAKTVEDMPGCFVTNIEKSFHLSRALSEEYAALVFISGFRVEMNKKRLSFLSFGQVKTVCLLLIDNWMDDDVSEEPALDKDFLVSLKELKVVLDRDKEHRNAVASRLRSLPDGVALSPRSFSEMETNFKMLTRSIISLAQSLASAKDVKDFFPNLIEKVVEPIKAIGLSKQEVGEVLKAYSAAVTDSAATSNELVVYVEENVRRNMARFMKALAPAVTAVF